MSMAATDAETAAPGSGLVELATEGKAGLFATFGGQGYRYIDEARRLYAHPAAGPFVKAAATALAAEASSEEVRAAPSCTRPGRTSPLPTLATPCVSATGGPGPRPPWGQAPCVPLGSGFLQLPRP